LRIDGNEIDGELIADEGIGNHDGALVSGHKSRLNRSQGLNDTSCFNPGVSVR
jgi:hypothetical protein